MTRPLLRLLLGDRLLLAFARGAASHESPLDRELRLGRSRPYYLTAAWRPKNMERNYLYWGPSPLAPPPRAQPLSGLSLGV
jgi:hypothetical protein